jgi:NADH-quinone oxidoreductase subunit L
MFLTFYGEPRGDKHTHEHAHESPWTMLIPLGVLALGAIFAGMDLVQAVLRPYRRGRQASSVFPWPRHADAAWRDRHGRRDGHGDNADADRPITEDRPRSRRSRASRGALRLYRLDAGRGRDLHPPRQHVLDEAHHVPTWVKLSPFIAMLLGFARGVRCSTSAGRSCPGSWPRNQRPLYQFLLNKWYFDEIYDFRSSCARHGLGRFLWKRGDGNIIDGGINGLAMGIVPFFTRLAGGRSRATSSPMPSRWCSASRPGHLDDDRRGGD